MSPLSCDMNLLFVTIGIKELRNKERKRID